MLEPLLVYLRNLLGQFVSQLLCQFSTDLNYGRQTLFCQALWLLMYIYHSSWLRIPMPTPQTPSKLFFERLFFGIFFARLRVKEASVLVTRSLILGWAIILDSLLWSAFCRLFASWLNARFWFSNSTSHLLPSSHMSSGLVHPSGLFQGLNFYLKLVHMLKYLD